MRPDLVVVVTPKRQLSPGIIEGVEQFLIQQLVTQAAVEGLDESILLGLARIDIVPVDTVLVRSFQDCPAGELCDVTPSEWTCPGLERVAIYLIQDSHES